MCPSHIHGLDSILFLLGKAGEVPYLLSKSRHIGEGTWVIDPLW
jgi:hypothetical protein